MQSLVAFVGEVMQMQGRGAQRVVVNRQPAQKAGKIGHS